MTIITKDAFRSRGRVKEASPEIWEQYKATGEESLRNRLIEHYLPIVRYSAERVLSKLPQSVELGDLFSAGVFGLMDAIEGYDIDRKVKFKTYCALRIRGAILDHLRQSDWVPRLVRTKANRVNLAMQELETLLGRKANDLELADHLDMSLSELDSLVSSGTATQIMSLSDKWHDENGGKAVQTIDIIPDKREVDPVDKIQSNDFMELVSKRLNMKERLIVMLYYFEELTMREIGMILDLSESRVCQLHARIIKRLQKELGERKDELLS
jgi:RNA polymerase sigma factor FliA